VKICPHGHKRVGKPGVTWGESLWHNADSIPLGVVASPWSSPSGLYLLVHIPRFTTRLVKGPLTQVGGFAFGTSLYPRKNRYLLEVARSLLLTMNLPKPYWEDVILAAAYLINKIPLKTLNFKSPLEVLQGIPLPILFLQKYLDMFTLFTNRILVNWNLALLNVSLWAIQEYKKVISVITRLLESTL
jgi:hypothetical protein